MGEIVKQVRNVFIDSETNQNIDETQVQVNLVPTDFYCGADENMRMTLTTFEMRTNWYNINQYNNIFYLWTPTTPLGSVGTYYPVRIPASTYYDFVDTTYSTSAITATGLATAIQTALNGAGVGTGHTCVYNVNTRKLTIVLAIAGSGGLLTANTYLVSFQVPPTTGSPPTGISFQNFFVDTNEIMGGKATKTAPVSGTLAPTSMFGTGVLATTLTFVSPYVCQLNSMEALYLRSNLQSANYGTYGFSQSIFQNRVTQTTTFARIPLVNQNYEVLNPFVFFDDKNDLFTIEIGNKQLDQLTLFLTDDKNRFIPLVSTGQVIDGMMSFKATIKWEVLLRDSAKPFIPTIKNLTDRLIAFPNRSQV